MNIRIPVPGGGEMPAYLALPQRPTAGVVVIQEIFGITDAMKAICDMFASRQFVALCPEMFWRTDPGAVIPEAESEKGRACRAKVSDEAAIGDIAAAVDFLRGHEMVSQGVGVVGYCWGGLLAYLTATEARPDAAVSYYGVGIDQRLDRVQNLSCPIMLHYGGQDARADATHAAKIQEALGAEDRARVHVYPEAGHAFARPKGAHYHHPSADLANMRTLSFFTDKLIGRRVEKAPI